MPQCNSSDGIHFADTLWYMVLSADHINEVSMHNRSAMILGRAEYTGVSASVVLAAKLAC